MWLSYASIVTIPFWKPFIHGSSGSGHISSDLGPVPLFLMPSIINPPPPFSVSFVIAELTEPFIFTFGVFFLAGFLRRSYSSIHPFTCLAS